MVNRVVQSNVNGCSEGQRGVLVVHVEKNLLLHGFYIGAIYAKKEHQLK